MGYSDVRNFKLCHRNSRCHSDKFTELQLQCTNFNIGDSTTGSRHRCNGNHFRNSSLGSCHSLLQNQRTVNISPRHESQTCLDIWKPSREVDTIPTVEIAASGWPWQSTIGIKFLLTTSLYLSTHSNSSSVDYQPHSGIRKNHSAFLEPANSLRSGSYWSHLFSEPVSIRRSLSSRLFRTHCSANGNVLVIWSSIFCGYATGAGIGVDQGCNLKRGGSGRRRGSEKQVLCVARGWSRRCLGYNHALSISLQGLPRYLGIGLIRFLGLEDLLLWHLDVMKHVLPRRKAPINLEVKQ